MNVAETAIPGVLLITPKRFGDDRGWFSETYRADVLRGAGADLTFLQDNQSFSANAGTIRGLHFQVAPNPQTKLVRVLAGAILDVAVDIRPGSPTFLKHVAVRLDAAEGAQLLVPAGFAHGFCTLEPNTMVAYKVDAYYSAPDDRNLRWNDPAIGIDWPFGEAEATLSDKDRKAPSVAEAGLTA